MIWNEVEVPTRSRAQMIDVTDMAAGDLARSGVKSGICHVYVPHTTAGITINENADPDVVTDILAGLERMVPYKANYRHAEGNSDAHIKASLLGFTVSVPVVNGRLALGTWQGIYFCEFDGPRRRKMLVGIEGK